jgi:hypothetical protein
MHDEALAKYAANPSELVELCRQIFDQLDAATEVSGMQETEAQLREISRSIKRLERSKVPVPDVLRSEKNRLAATLCSNENLEALNRFADELDALVTDMKVRLLREGDLTDTQKKAKRRWGPSRTSRDDLKVSLIQALKNLGGRAKAAATIDEMGKLLQGKLLPGDLEWRQKTNEYVWQNNAKWLRYRLVKDGTLKKDSGHGYWELSEDHA